MMQLPRVLSHHASSQPRTPALYGVGSVVQCQKCVLQGACGALCGKRGGMVCVRKREGVWVCEWGERLVVGEGGGRC